jgi:hypothetical protein
MKSEGRQLKSMMRLKSLTATSQRIRGETGRDQGKPKVAEGGWQPRPYISSAERAVSKRNWKVVQYKAYLEAERQKNTNRLDQTQRAGLRLFARRIAGNKA